MKGYRKEKEEVKEKDEVVEVEEVVVGGRCLEGTKVFAYLEGCPRGLGCSLVLRGGDAMELNQVGWMLLWWWWRRW